MKTTLLLVNLGTPNSPEPKEVRRYLNEFLLDPDVIDAPWLLRQFLVRRIIVPRRYKESADSYSKIWTQQGSPLLFHSENIAQALAKKLEGEVDVELAMRYQNPSLPSVLKRIEQKGCDRLIVLPLFPQYATATTGTIKKRIDKLLSKWDTKPELEVIDHFANDPHFIRTLAENGSMTSEYDHILFSFHGLPQRYLTKGDKSRRCLASPDCCANRPLADNCYRSHCLATAHAIASELYLTPDQYTICFQSRLGKEEWLKPYASETIKNLANNGTKSLLVFSPSFVCDCLETLFEIGVEYRDMFIEYGGDRLDLVKAVNDHPNFIDGLEELVRSKMQERVS